jgi:hypothetical protein
MKEKEERMNGRRQTAQKEIFFAPCLAHVYFIKGFFFSFFTPILLCSHNGETPDEELAKFGYRFREQSRQTFKILLYFGNLLSKKFAISKKKIARNLGTYPSTLARSTHVCRIIN